MALTIVETRAITGGVDTHADVHVTAALDPVGGLLGVREFATTPDGYARLLGWLGGFGTVSHLARNSSSLTERAVSPGSLEPAAAQCALPAACPAAVASRDSCSGPPWSRAAMTLTVFQQKLVVMTQAAELGTLPVAYPDSAATDAADVSAMPIGTGLPTTGTPTRR
jgi:hypothetical protein